MKIPSFLVFITISATMSLGLGVAFAAFFPGYAQIREGWGNQMASVFLVRI